MGIMPIPEIKDIPILETIENYYKRCGLVFNQKRFDECQKENELILRTLP